MKHIAAIGAVLLLAACQPGNSPPGGDTIATPAGKPHAFTAVGAGETLRFAGTEPFWGGSLDESRLTWTTPENAQGTVIAAERRAGNNGLGVSGELAGRPLDMAVTLAPCSDGMSDRRYPFTVTVRLGTETLNGCGWTDRMPASGGG